VEAAIAIACLPLNRACGDAGRVHLIRKTIIMNAPAVSRRAPALKPLAFAIALSVCLGAAAQEQSLPTVNITGARFGSDPALAPIGATVITAEQIRSAGAADVNQAIRKIGGVYGRQSLDASPDFGLDLRGFGANSSQNLVITLDGVRLSENELASAVLSSIPIETVERIEIIRGGASVLYGEGATGGVIQIVTKRPAQNSRRGTLRAEAGQFGLADLRASIAQAWDGFALDAAIGKQRSDNYRDHNAYDQATFSGGVQWAHADGRVGLRLDSARQESEFPGSMSLAQFSANPRQATTLKDFGAVDSDRATAFMEQRLGEVDVAAELSYRRKTVESTYFYDFGAGEFASALAYESAQSQFSPRLRHLGRMDGKLNELVFGVDLIRWTRKTLADFSNADATQFSSAFYVRDEIKWDAPHNARFSLGARRETFNKDYIDPLTASADHSRQTQNAWEVQGSFNLTPALNLYARTGRSYRVPNADENSFRSSATVLAIQTSRDLELGALLGDSRLGLTARVFRHDLTNEIFYDPTAPGPFGPGANANLAPTERKGVELDAHAALGASLRLSATLQHVKASFTQGPNAGREMVLVPKNVLTTRLAWAPGNGNSADLGVQWVDSQRYGSDFANDCGATIPSYATVDARYARQLGAWELSVAALNLGDKQYFSNAFGCRSAIYPSDGRQVKLAARYDF
jgi:iron complex outermembrane receptor protein